MHGRCRLKVRIYSRQSISRVLYIYIHTYIHTHIYILLIFYLFTSTQAKKRGDRCCRLADSGTAGVPVYGSYDPNCFCMRSAAR